MVKGCRIFNRFYYDADALGDLHAVASGFLTGESDKSGLMLISGPSGSGKTTLARALMMEAEKHGKLSKVLTTMEYVSNLMEKFSRNESPELLLYDYQAYDLLILEEYDRISGKLSTQQEVRTRLLKPLLETGKKIAITFINGPDCSSMISLPAHIRIDLAPADIYVRRAFARACARDLRIEIDRCTEVYLAAKCPIHAIKANLQHRKLTRAI